MKHHKAKKEHHTHPSGHKTEHSTEHKPEHHAAKHKRAASAEHSGISGNTERVLVENFVALQKVIAELAKNFDSLSSRITKLLDLFEISAKTLAEKDFETGRDARFEKELNQKMDTLVEHNKLFARGLSLLHERTSGEQIEMEPRIQSNPVPQMQKRMEIGDNYQKSISSKP